MLSVSVSSEASLGSLCLLLHGTPVIKKLVVKHYKDPSSLAKLIPALASPAKVEHLVLSAAAGVHDALPAKLNQLSRLKKITFRGNFSHLGRDSFDVLRALPIKRIEVAKRSDISSVELVALLKSRGRLPSLKKLHLDNDIDDGGLECGWILPRWTQSFCDWDRHDLISEAASNGIEITGSFLSATKTRTRGKMPWNRSSRRWRWERTRSSPSRSRPTMATKKQLGTTSIAGDSPGSHTEISALVHVRLLASPVCDNDPSKVSLPARFAKLCDFSHPHTHDHSLGPAKSIVQIRACDHAPSTPRSPSS